MQYLKKLRPFIWLTAFVTSAIYLINIVSIIFSTSNLVQVTGKAQMISGFISDQALQKIQMLMNLVSNANMVYKAYIVIGLIGGLIIAVGGLLLIGYFAGRVIKKESVLNYVGLIGISGALCYMMLTSFALPASFIALLLIASKIATLLLAGAVLGIAAIKFYRYLVREGSKLQWTEVGIDFLKVLAIFVIIITGFVIVTKVVLYTVATSVIANIELADYIDILDYFQINWQQIIPQQLLASGLVSPQDLNVLVNHLFDQYVLTFVSDFLQGFLTRFAGNIIFANLAAYCFSLIASIGILISSLFEFEYRPYVVAGIAIITGIFIIFAVGGMLLSLLSGLMMLSVILIVIGILKDYSDNKQLTVEDK